MWDSTSAIGPTRWTGGQRLLVPLQSFCLCNMTSERPHEPPGPMPSSDPRHLRMLCCVRPCLELPSLARTGFPVADHIPLWVRQGIIGTGALGGRCLASRRLRVSHAGGLDRPLLRKQAIRGVQPRTPEGVMGGPRNCDPSRHLSVYHPGTMRGGRRSVTAHPDKRRGCFAAASWGGLSAMPASALLFRCSSPPG